MSADSPAADFGRWLQEALQQLHETIQTATLGAIELMYRDGTRGARVHTRFVSPGLGLVYVDAYLHDDVEYGVVEEWTDHHRVAVRSIDWDKAAVWLDLAGRTSASDT